MTPKTLKFTIVLFLTLAMTSQAHAQYNCSDKHYEDSQGTKHILNNPSAKIKNIIDRILTISNINDATDYRLCAIPRGFGNVVINPRLRFIVYDQSYLHNLARSAGEMHWGIVAVMAHEIGHHVFASTGSSSLNTAEQQLYRELAGKQQSRMEELKADMFAGTVLASLGASLDNSKALMRAIKSPGDDTWSTQPSGPKRVEAVTIGWRDACKKLGRECNDPVMKSRNQVPAINTSPRHNGIAETPGYSRLMTLANSFKGKRVNQNYCKMYASVSTQQAKRNQQYQCGHSVDSSDAASQWSLQWRPQYDWCVQMSAYATQKEAQYREKKLIECQR